MLAILKLIITGIVITFSAQITRADWINLTGAENAPNIAEIYIEEGQIRIILEIFLNDIEKFQPIKSQQFSSIRLTTGANKKVLRLSEVSKIERRLRKDRYSPYKDINIPIPGTIVTRPPEDPRVYYVELIYKLDHQPEIIHFTPPVDASGLSMVNMGFMVYHKGIPVTDFRYLSTNEELQLNWDDPWYTVFKNKNLGRHHQSPITSYVYIEHYEVRHEILIRPKDLSHWMDLEISGEHRIEVEELTPLLQRVSHFLMTRNPILIDGKPTQPILDKAEYVDLSLYGIQTIYPTKALELNTAIIGVTIRYLTPGVPKQVEMQWDLFNTTIRTVPATSTDPAGPLITYLTPDDNILIWQNYLKDFDAPKITQIPFEQQTSKYFIWQFSTTLIAVIIVLVYLFYRRKKRPQLAILFVLLVSITFLILSGIRLFNPPIKLSTTSKHQASEVIETLLKNVYRAFNLKDEAEVYDKLALTIEGEFLESIYLKQRHSLKIKEAGGATANVNRVKLVGINEEKNHNNDNTTLTYTVRWTIEGTVTHWGHSHQRENLYEGRITLTTKDNMWKIQSLKTLNEKRLAAKTITNNNFSS